MSVLILGAKSRIAAEVAHRYAEDGHAIYLAARDEKEAALIASDIRIRYGVTAESGAFDALEFDKHAEFVNRVEEAVGPIEVALVAFGAMGEQSVSEEDFTAAHKVIDTNYTAAVSIAEALAAKMIERGEGTIIGISSVAGDRGRQSNYFYGSAKGAFTLYLQGLRGRFFQAGPNLHVLTVKLGLVDTRMTYGKKSPVPMASPEAVSRAIFKAERSHCETIYYPHFWRGIMGVLQHMPEILFKRVKF